MTQDNRAALADALREIADGIQEDYRYTGGAHYARKLRALAVEVSATPSPATQAGELTMGERHELECLRTRVRQIEYPCSPHCEGYLRELALRNITNEMVEQAVFAYAKYWGKDTDPKRYADWCAQDKASMRAALTAAQLRPTADGWRTIDSAPKDGVPVIIAVMPEGAVGEAYYDADRDEWDWTNTHWSDPTGDCIRYPTHWMPLPSIPAAPAPPHMEES